jgi:AcrR family transcriptional regulator
MKIPRRTQADRSAATRAALVAAGRRLFAAHGFAGVGTEAIVREAEVSRGALYHQFADKTALFAAVLEDVERKVTEKLVAVVVAEDGAFVDVMTHGVEAWLDACEEPDVRRIVLVDGPSVLGWVRWREICQPHVLGLVEAALAQGMADGTVDRQPVTPLAHLLLAVADEAAMYVVTHSDPAGARHDIVAIVRRLLESLTRTTEQPPDTVDGRRPRRKRDGQNR